MADKKAPGRPKRAEAPKRSEAPKKFTLESSEIKNQKDAKINQSTDQLEEGNAPGLDDKEKVNEFEDIKDQDNVSTSNKETTEAEKAKGEKVVEVKVETQNKTRLRPSEKRKITHTVFVKGKSREMSREAYEAVSKDPALNVELPKGSRLAEPELEKPCKDC